MAEAVRDFYDELAGNYDLMFEDWEASMARQAAALGAILDRECDSARPLRILDCACGIGTQALGLAKLGFRVTGSDVSPRAIERARAEAAKRGLHLSLYVADMRQMSDIPETGFDAVISMDNALPHLSSDEHLAEAAAQQEEIVAAMRDILRQMSQWDSFVDVLNQLDEIIKLQTHVEKTTEQLREKEVQGLFQP